MLKTVFILLALPLILAAKPEPEIALSNPTPSFGEIVSFQVGRNDNYLHGQEESVFTMQCYQPTETGPQLVLDAWWYGTQTITLGTLPLPPYFNDIWAGGSAQCELYVYAYGYHQGMFTGYREIAELEFYVLGE